MARIAVLIGPGFEDAEYTGPARALEDAGHTLVRVGVEPGEVRGKHGEKATVEKACADVSMNDFDALFIPGGNSPDNIRRDEDVVGFAKEFMMSGKPVLAICHGPQVLISGDAVRGRTMTAWTTVQKDLELAGADVKDERVVVDGNLVTSRGPDDIPYFIDASLELLAQAGPADRGAVGAEA